MKMSRGVTLLVIHFWTRSLQSTGKRGFQTLEGYRRTVEIFCKMNNKKCNYNAVCTKFHYHVFQSHGDLIWASQSLVISGYSYVYKYKRYPKLPKFPNLPIKVIGRRQKLLAQFHQAFHTLFYILYCPSSPCHNVPEIPPLVNVFVSH